ncbi:unnamed protein product, partial [Gulo gulo]
MELLFLSCPGFGTRCGVNFRLVPTGPYTQKGAGKESPRIPSIPSWEGKKKSCPNIVGGIQKPCREIQLVLGALQGPWKLLRRVRPQEPKGYLLISEGQQIFLLFLSTREGRPLGSLPQLSLTSPHRTWEHWGQDLYSETLRFPAQ